MSATNVLGAGKSESERLHSSINKAILLNNRGILLQPHNTNTKQNTVHFSSFLKSVRFQQLTHPAERNASPPLALGGTNISPSILTAVDLFGFARKVEEGTGTPPPVPPPREEGRSPRFILATLLSSSSAALSSFLLLSRFVARSVGNATSPTPRVVLMSSNSRSMGQM